MRDFIQPFNLSCCPLMIFCWGPIYSSTMANYFVVMCFKKGLSLKALCSIKLRPSSIPSPQPSLFPSGFPPCQASVGRHIFLMNLLNHNIIILNANFFDPGPESQNLHFSFKKTSLIVAFFGMSFSRLKWSIQPHGGARGKVIEP